MFLRIDLDNYLMMIGKNRPGARAMIQGSSDYPTICGEVSFYQSKDGVLLVANIAGLPYNTNACNSRIFGFHIHEGSACTGNESDPFANAKGHYNPYNCDHPYHAGDLPPLFENRGHAFMIFLSNRFTLDEVIGRTVIIHDMPDDFKTQPSGNSGKKIACGIIIRYAT